MIYRLDRLSDSHLNPVTGRAYDDSWIVFQLTDSTDYQQMSGCGDAGVYTISVSRKRYRNWEMAVGDLIDFCEANGKNAIVVMSEKDLRAAKKRYEGHRHNDPFLRDDEPAVLVHSTPMNSWNQIKRDGMLKSWNRLQSEQAIDEERPIGAWLGDPLDFSDFIMLGTGVAGEIIVSSKQQGTIVMNPDAAYLTGARLYFDAEIIARDGLLVRDGCHLKVRDTLPLQPYLIWTATWDTIGLASQVSTPKCFAEQADKRFLSVSKHDDGGREQASDA